jgi:hypothetical protein
MQNILALNKIHVRDWLFIDCRRLLPAVSEMPLNPV